MIRVACSLAAALLAFAAPAAALPTRLGSEEGKIRTLFYDADRVVALNAFFGFQTMIQFGSDERIENVAIGDGGSWQVTPNKAADLLFVKPVERATRTNMTVVTDRRSYLFELIAHPGLEGRAEGVTYVVRFIYPTPPSPPPPPPEVKPAPPERRNTAYTYTGARELLPSLVFDDGRSTYFQWPDAAPAPAIFVVGADGAESIVDYTFKDGFQVVAQLSPRFRLRSGKTLTTVINEGWRPPSPGADAPKPHDAKTAREALREERTP